MSTAPVARDIIEIFERHGEWREAEAKRLLKTSNGLKSTTEQSEIFQRTLYRRSEEKVQYWGFVSILPCFIDRMC